MRLAILAIAALTLPTATGATVLQAANGRIINTKDGLYQQAKVRVKSIGSPLCGIQIIFAGQAKLVVAHAGHWSEWYPIGAAINGGAYVLTFEPQCDTGALGEIMVEVDP